MDSSVAKIEEEGIIEIDGSILEGGGQILRVSISLSTILKKPIHIKNIRAGRKDGGLKLQHLTGINLVGEMFPYKMTGNELRSTSLSYHPGDYEGSGKYIGEINSAGSIALLCQVSLPTLLYTSKETHLTLIGGTNASHAPPIHYFQYVLFPLLERMGLHLSMNIKRYGFYPKGGGLVELVVQSLRENTPLMPMNLTTQGNITEIEIIAYISGNVPEFVSQRATKSALKQLNKSNLGKYIKFIKTSNILTSKEAEGSGSGIVIIIRTDSGCILGGSSLGEGKKKSPEDMGRDAALEVATSFSFGACVDEWAQDQLLIFFALAEGKSSYICGPLTLHSQTAIHFLQVFGAEIITTPLNEKETKFLVEVSGIGKKWNKPKVELL